ncbi:alpha/beta fold hydrolase [Actinomadura parmotrematis]|uniref:Alpha/beta hydrolase n=1 Tax=Actinomadura parmotrematis TaxID=2864039 RepID=A0ABS7FW52_9ACTN|nr:alpha/beta fold hydrolase [Actinomadura parmotrematis]MBW8483668.1 alpha/beta hydrolase [Actinomadura parmotrematis]
MPASFRLPGMVCTDHLLDVPLDHADPGGPAIGLYAREVVAAGREDAGLPWLLFLQGGPGGKATRPNAGAAWLPEALKHYRVLLMDQRGTGRSTPATRQTLPADPADAAAYLGHFRADAIVRDAELLRRRLAGDRPWSVLGQSFGGFCTVTYLSQAPEGLAEAFVTGGLPGLTTGPDEVYRAAYPRVLAHNERYFARYPGDRDAARRVRDHLAEHDVRLPGGDRLTPRRFQTLGIAFGSSARFDALHFLLEEAFAGEELSDAFLRGVDAEVSYAGQPLYALLHEAIYCQGGASRWAAERVRAEFPEFAPDADEVRFTGEMIYPWFFDEDPALRPLRDAAGLLADRADWPALYDAGRLAANTVPVAAAVYHDDMYVDREDSLRTAAAIRGLKPWVTSEYAHNGLAADGRVFARLRAMARGEV